MARAALLEGSLQDFGQNMSLAQRRLVWVSFCSALSGQTWSIPGTSATSYTHDSESSPLFLPLLSSKLVFPSESRMSPSGCVPQLLQTQYVHNGSHLYTIRSFLLIPFLLQSPVLLNSIYLRCKLWGYRCPLRHCHAFS